MLGENMSYDKVGLPCSRCPYYQSGPKWIDDIQPTGMHFLLHLKTGGKIDRIFVFQ